MTEWKEAKEYQEITYHKGDGIARIAFNRPEVRNAFTPLTVNELIEAFQNAWNDNAIGVVLFTGNGPAKDGKYAFCSGGDQRVRGDAARTIGANYGFRFQYRHPGNRWRRSVNRSGQLCAEDLRRDGASRAALKGK